MSNDDKILQSLVAGGLIGAALGALLSKKGDGAGLGALAGAAILATYRANEEAQKTNLPMYTEENGDIYKIEADGKKVFIRHIDRPHVRVRRRFKLK